VSPWKYSFEFITIFVHTYSAQCTGKVLEELGSYLGPITKSTPASVSSEECHEKVMKLTTISSFEILVYSMISSFDPNQYDVLTGKSVGR
jgi:hypothetical protein